MVELAVVKVGDLLLNPGGEGPSLALIVTLKLLSLVGLTEGGIQAAKVGQGNVTELLRGKGELLI